MNSSNCEYQAISIDVCSDLHSSCVSLKARFANCYAATSSHFSLCATKQFFAIKTLFMTVSTSSIGWLFSFASLAVHMPSLPASEFSHSFFTRNNLHNCVIKSKKSTEFNVNKSALINRQDAVVW